MSTSVSTIQCSVNCCCKSIERNKFLPKLCTHSSGCLFSPVWQAIKLSDKVNKLHFFDTDRPTGRIGSEKAANQRAMSSISFPHSGQQLSVRDKQYLPIQLSDTF